MIIWFGLACFAVGIFIGMWWERSGGRRPWRSYTFSPTSEEELDEHIELLREDLRRELMDGFYDQEDLGGAG